MESRQKTSIRQFILDACEVSSVEYLRELPLLMKWARQADISIKAPNRYQRKIKVDTISNCKIPIPCDGVYIKNVVYGDYGCDCTTMFETLNNYTLNCSTIDLDECYVFYWQDASYRVTDISWQVKGDCIEFQGLDDVTVTFEYLAYETDKDGFPVVFECHRDAIVHYIKHQLLERMKWKLLAAGKPANQVAGESRAQKKLYRRGIRYAKGIHNEQSLSQQEDNSIMYNDPLSGRKNYLLDQLY